MPQDRIQGEIALETWEALYKEKDNSPTVLVQQIIDHHEQIAKEKVARAESELQDALALVAQQSTKIKSMAKAAKLLAAGSPKVTATGGKSSKSESSKSESSKSESSKSESSKSKSSKSESSKSAKSDSPQDPSRETWDGTVNYIGATIHLLQADELYRDGDMKGLTTVAENAVTCAGKQLDKKLLAEAWIWLGTGYSTMGNLKSGVEAFKRAQEAIKTLNQKDKDVASMKVLIDKWQGDLKEPEAKLSAMLAKMQKR